MRTLFKETRMAQKSGEKLFTALKEVGDILLPKEVTRKYPKAATLVINPLDGTIPKEDKVEKDKTVDVSADQYVYLKFLGAARYIENRRDCIGFQIAVLKKNPELEYVMQGRAQGLSAAREFSKHRWEAIYVTDPTYIESDDIDLAKAAMKETIEGWLLEQCDKIVRMELARYIVKAKKGVLMSPPWFLEKRKILSRVGGFFKGK